MRIAVVHHRTRDDMSADTYALIAAARSACEQGAGTIVLPAVPSLEGFSADERDEFMARIDGCAEGAAVFATFDAPGADGFRIVDTPLGRTALVSGDSCLRLDLLTRLAEDGLDATIWRPRAESALQAEAVLEFALGCAPLLAGVLIVAECAGGPDGEGCRGASAIIHAGEIVAEADGDDDEILFADLDVPQQAPESGGTLPGLPLILEQRRAVHEGRKPSVDYLADLS